MVEYVRTCAVEGCTFPTKDELCSGHLAELVTALRELAFGVNGRGDRSPGLIEDLDDTVFRQDNIGPRGVGGRSRTPEVPLPIHLAASDLKWACRNTITTWARDFAETYPHLTLTASTPHGAAEWMGTFPALLACHPAAGEMWDEIVDLTERVRRMVDQAPDRLVLGPCGAEFDGYVCDDELRAIPGRAMVRCRTCGAEHGVRERSEWLLSAAEDQCLTVPELSRALSGFIGQEVKADALRMRIRRSDPPIEPRGLNENGREIYRVGTIIDLLFPQKKEEEAA